MDLSNWRFRRALESMASYPDSKPFRVEIERGSKQVLSMAIREIEMLLAEPNENPFAKFLAVRFCRQLMLIGNAHIITNLERLVPSLLKICSYRLDSQDPNRGTTYFQSHPSYLKGSPEEKEQLKLLGSSLHIICLESVKAWAEWVPVSPNGSESAFKKGYNTLVERGVSFCSEQQYYKKTDYERFSNTYKVEFFDESEALDQQSEADESTIPAVEAELAKTLKLRKELLVMLSQNKPNASQEFERLVGRIEQFHREEIGKLERTIEQTSRSEYDKKRNLEVLFRHQNWSEAVLKYYSQLLDRKFTWQDFAAKCLSYQDPQSGELTQTVRVPVQEINLQTAFRKPSQPTAQNASYNLPPADSEPINSAYAKLEQTNTELKASLKQQKSTYEGIIYQLELDNNKRKQEVAQLRQQLADKEKSLRDECEARLTNLKMTYSTDPKKQAALQQNNELRESIRRLNEELTSIRRKKVEAPLQQFMEPPADAYRPIQEFRRLEDELRAIRESCRQHTRQLEEQGREMSRLQNRSRQLLDELQSERQSKGDIALQANSLRKTLSAAKQIEQQLVKQMKKMEASLQKTMKQNVNLLDEIVLYKQQLAQLRGKSHQEMKLESQKTEEALYRLRKQLEEATRLNTELKSQQVQAQLELVKVTELQKRAQRESAQQQLNLQTPIRLASPPRDLTERSNRTYSNFGDLHNDRVLFTNTASAASRNKSPFGVAAQRSQQQHPLFVQVAGMEQFQQYFTKMPRDCYLRFCRSCLKNKELLYKENELEVGVISERMSASKLRLVLHYTNNADAPLRDFKAKLYSPRTIKTVVVSDVAASIEPAEQEKEEVTHEVLEYPVRRVCLELSYEKGGRREVLSLVLPVLLLKLVEYVQPIRQAIGARILDSRSCRINRKVLPPGKTIQTYIPQFQQWAANIYDVDVIHKESALCFHLQLRQKDEALEMAASTDQSVLSQQQTALLLEYMGNLQMVLGR